MPQIDNSIPSGLLLVDKPAGPTSHHIVSKVKRMLKADRVGHLGTLDPFASGLLPILINGATRLADEIMDGRKTYLFTIAMGNETDTLDHTGRIIDTKPVPENFGVKCSEVLSQFVGKIEQVPPVYSALKMNGMPLYEHMRGTGKLPVDIETKRRVVNVETLEAVRYEEIDEQRNAVLRVMCGKGTYVRSLARDISYAVGTVGSCSQLRREYVEPWHVNDAVDFSNDAQFSKEELIAKMLTPFQMLPEVPFLQLRENERHFIAAGNVFYVEMVDFESRVKLSEGKTKIFVGIENILFLAEISTIDERVKIQPRKKIS